MANKTWTVDLEDGRHTVEVEHAYLSGKRVIRVDGREVVRDRSLLDFGSDHLIQVGSHPALVRISTNGFSFSYDLAVDGKSVDTGKDMGEHQHMPKWAAVVISLFAVLMVFWAIYVIFILGPST